MFLWLILPPPSPSPGKLKLESIRKNSNFFRKALEDMGLEVLGDYDSPVIPIMLFNPTKIAAFSRECMKRGVRWSLLPPVCVCVCVSCFLFLPPQTLFSSHFRSLGGLQYLDGGVASGFAHVERDVYEPALFQIKGKRNVRTKQVCV